MTAVVAAIIAVSVIVLLIYNYLVNLRNLVKEAFSTMDIYLKKRWDLVPNLVATVRAYATYEQEAFENVVRARTMNYSDMDMKDKLDADKTMADGVAKLVALGESYPNLMASESFSNLAKELTNIENEIAKSRKYYNGCVRLYNTKIEQFPNSLFAGAMGFEKWEMFAAEANERRNVRVDV